jgi:hypothetical protein
MLRPTYSNVFAAGQESFHDSNPQFERLETVSTVLMVSVAFYLFVAVIGELIAFRGGSGVVFDMYRSVSESEGHRVMNQMSQAKPRLIFNMRCYHHKKDKDGNKKTVTTWKGSIDLMFTDAADNRYVHVCLAHELRIAQSPPAQYDVCC